MSEEAFLSRWSRLKRSDASGDEARTAPAAVALAVPAAPAMPSAPPHEASENAPPTALPAIESLTPDSDFTPFLKPDVDPGLRRQALKALFQDPHFNVMDGLDVYIDDYSKPDPLPAGWLEKMNQMARLGEYIEPPAEEAEGAKPVPVAAADGLPAPQGPGAAPEEGPSPASPSDTSDEAGAAPPLTESAGRAPGE